MQREQRVAGDHVVGRRPHDRADRRERGVAEALRPGRRPRHPQEVQAGEQPRLRAQQARAREQDPHRPAAPGALALEHRRPEDQRHVGHVDVPAGGEEGEVEAGEQQRRRDHPDERREGELAEPVDPPHHQQEAHERHADPHAVAGLPQQAQQRAGDDRERMLGRHPEALEHRLGAVEHLPPPQQRVVGVVVRIGRVDEEPDREAEAQQRERDAGDRARVEPPQAGGQTGARARPGDGRGLHGGVQDDGPVGRRSRRRARTGSGPTGLGGVGPGGPNPRVGRPTVTSPSPYGVWADWPWGCRPRGAEPPGRSADGHVAEPVRGLGRLALGVSAPGGPTSVAGRRSRRRGLGPGPTPGRRPSLDRVGPRSPGRATPQRVLPWRIARRLPP